jgi:hypothetical protein
MCLITDLNLPTDFYFEKLKKKSRTNKEETFSTQFLNYFIFIYFQNSNL